MIAVKMSFADGAQPKMPTRAYQGDAGWDLYASRSVLIMAGQFRDVHTDICIAPPLSIWSRVVARSSTARKYGLLVQEGIIDTGYRGEMFFGVWNLSKEDFTVKVGDRLAQLIFMHHVGHEWMERVDELSESDRGPRGFGSSG